ncbi:MAG: class I SAM-dependent methyltransferase [Solirubrobacterales bacterium]|nr:class I SAM-dependent methyltransferase [Solirubrobacterales bacterium]
MNVTRTPRRIARAGRTAYRQVKYRTRHSTHPDQCATEGPSWPSVEFFKTTDSKVAAEIGTYRGDTAEQFARILAERGGVLHIFDFQDRVGAVVQRLAAQGLANVVPHGNTYRTLDSYNWSLMEMLRDNSEPIFDYVMIDGAHTWHHDGFAFLLADRLLRPEGYVEFHDYDWTLAGSPTMNPSQFPATRRFYSEDQIGAEQVRLIVDLLVRRDPCYEEIVPDRIFRKHRSA